MQEGGLSVEFDALSVGTDAGTVALIPLDESSVENAMLILVVPELLAQVKCVIAMMEKVPVAGDALGQEVRDLFMEINVLRAAIAKATRSAA